MKRLKHEKAESLKKSQHLMLTQRILFNHHGFKAALYLKANVSRRRHEFVLSKTLQYEVKLIKTCQ